MVMATTPIRRIYEMPDHPRYGPVRRMWIMLEQLFADRGGVKVLEVAMIAHVNRMRQERRTWDEQLDFILRAGLSEAAASRMVMQQLLVAAEIAL